MSFFASPQNLVARLFPSLALKGVISVSTQSVTVFCEGQAWSGGLDCAVWAAKEAGFIEKMLQF